MKYSALLILAVAFAIGCSSPDDSAQTPASTPDGLSQDQLENGLGPIRAVDLAAIDAELAAQGSEVFTIKCSACHKMAERYVGPALGDITARRSAPYIMNMMLNPEEMIQRHPEARKLFAQFMTPMPDQHLTQDEARAVLEFLRTQAN